MTGHDREHRRKLRELKQHAMAAGYLLGWKILGHLPERIADFIFKYGSDLIAKDERSMTQLRRNLARVVGPENVTRKLLKASVRSYARYWEEAFRLPTMSKNPNLYPTLYSSVQGLDHFDASFASGRGVVLTLPHTGNWDMAGTFLTHYAGQFTTVAERVKPEELFEAFVEFRRSLGFEVLPLTGGQRPPFERLREVLNQGGIVCLLGERDLRKSGVRAQFFGEETSLPVGPAKLALETGAALHVVHSWFIPDGWGFSISEELIVDNLESTVQRIADKFAANIKQHPADWHMFQPIWFSDLDPKRTPHLFLDETKK